MEPYEQARTRRVATFAETLPAVRSVGPPTVSEIRRSMVPL
jgi:hypothetical protein